MRFTDPLTVEISYKWPWNSDEWKYDRKILARVKQINSKGTIYGLDLIGRKPCNSLNAAMLRVRNKLVLVTKEIRFEFGEGISCQTRIVSL